MSGERRIAYEEQEQEMLFSWADLQSRQGGAYESLALLYAIPNGGKRAIKTAVALKKTGVKAGVPDVFLPAMRGGYGGLYIEMKRSRGGRTSPAQEGYIAGLRGQGYCVAVCHGFVEAKEKILEYLRL